MLVCSTWAFPWWAEDTFRWLENGEWYLLPTSDIDVDERDQAETLANKQEWYWLSDRFGNRYQLQAGNPVECLERVTVSQLFAALGVAHLPAFPFLLNRQLMGLPAGPANSPAWENACLIPVVSNEDRTMESVTDESISQVLIALAVMHAVRAGEQAFVFHRDQFFASRVANIFYSGSSTPKDVKDFLKFTFDGFYWQRATKFPPEMAERTIRHIRYAFNQLEYIAGHRMEELFDPLMRQSPSYWRHRIKSIQTVKTTWKNVILESRLQFQNYLTDVLGGVFCNASLAVDPLDKRDDVLIPQLRFVTPRVWEPVVDITDETFRRSNAKALLYAYYTGNTDEQRHMEQAWRGQLNRDPITELMQLADRYDSTTRIFNHSSHPLSGIDDLFTRPQPFINREAPSTVLVYNGRSQNGHIMKRLINRLESKGAHVRPFDTLGRVEGLSDEQVGSLRRLVSTSKSTRMFLAGVSNALAQQMFLEFGNLERIVMSCSDCGLLDWQKRSVLEQVMSAYNYYPALPETIITLFEKGGANGFQQLGYGRAEALRAMHKLSLPSSISFYSQNNGMMDAEGLIIPIVQRDGVDDGIGNSISLMNYGKPTNYLLWNPGSISLLLNPDLAWHLTRRLHEHPAITTLASHGDSSLGIFIEIEGPSAKTRALVDEINQVIDAWFSDHKGINPCVLTIVHAVTQ